jgi:hypothetical protein
MHRIVDTGSRLLGKAKYDCFPGLGGTRTALTGRPLADQAVVPQHSLGICQRPSRVAVAPHALQILPHNDNML